MTERKESPVEAIKRDSRHLRGEIAAELGDGLDHFSKDSTQLLKHHGTYEQDDRDARLAARQHGKSEKSFIYMVRTRIPGGLLNSEQLLAQLDLCDELANATLRITTRQGLQLHGVVKRDLKEVIQRIHRVQLTTLGACGDVNRNVMCCPGPYQDAVHQHVQALAIELAQQFAPRTGAYHEIWLRPEGAEEKYLVAGGEPEVEPLYGDVYLPRKFKMGIALPNDNCIDVYTQDLGLIAIVAGNDLRGFNVLAGGGQGVTPSAAKTYPALGLPIGFVAPEDAIDVARAIVCVQRDFGNREDRKQARLKYTIRHMGLETFREHVEQYLGRPLAAYRDVPVDGFNDHMGWEPQGDGRWFYGLNVENGRILDRENFALKSALRAICRELRPGVRLTAHQSMLLTDIPDAQRGRLEHLLRDHGVALSEEISAVRRWSMACVAWPTCGLSITESERALPGVIDDLQRELERLGLEREVFTVRMTGCPNGCARPYNCDIGLVGRAKDKYTVFVGGRLLGDRLNFQYKDMVPRDELVAELSVLFQFFKRQREPEETFGDFCHRQGVERLREWAAQHGRAA